MERIIDQAEESDSPVRWLWRTLLALEAWAHPAWGWGVLVSCMLLASLPAVALRANRWLALGAFQNTLEVTGPLAVLVLWLAWGWRSERRTRAVWQIVIGTLAGGLVIMSQLLLGWLPGLEAWWRALTTGGWAQLVSDAITPWTSAVTRFGLWREGVAAGGAAQDNLVFAIFGSCVLWLAGLLTGWLARGVRQGFVAAVPALWLLGMILLYSSSGRYLLVIAVALTLALHVLLEQRRLTRRWQRLGLDYSPGLVVDRLLSVLSAGAMILTLAAVMPNLYIEPVVNRYYTFFAPVNLAFESLGERLFPELRGTSRLRGGSGGGMPNEFLLRGGPDLGTAVVMRVRTNESAVYQFPLDEMAPPPAHYMRGRTLTLYDGRGWSNPGNLEQEAVAANARWGGVVDKGRKAVVQSIILESATTSLFAAPEPVEASADVRIEVRAANDLVAVQARESSYTVVSMVPAVDEAILRALPAWTTVGVQGEQDSLPLPEELAIHLEVPETVTERTRDLAAQLVEGRATPYDKALAIEQYLRQYEYDLEVGELPAEVEEVADYFMFELQRGYCDYYATAFVVLARLVGLPTRFATGFAAGQWDPVEGVFVISESDAHSWPEVYFPEVGWIPFEPTAGRAQLQRVALPQNNPAAVPPPAVPAAPLPEPEAAWNWQPLLWLLPVGGIVWALVWAWRWWRRRREDPWQAILQWGQRMGRPINDGETVLEYGDELSRHVLSNQLNTPDARRIAAREIQAVSMEVNRVRYGLADERASALAAIDAHWSRLRSYLRLVRVE